MDIHDKYSAHTTCEMKHLVDSKPIFGHNSIYKPPVNVREPQVFCVQGGYKETLA